MDVLPASGYNRTLSWLRDRVTPPERPLLHAPQLGAWAGFRIGIFEAATCAVRDQRGEHAVLAMILKGRTRTRMVAQGEHCDFSPGPDSLGLFGPRLDVDWAQWECEPGSERMVVELDLSTLAPSGDLEAMRPTGRTLHQQLNLRDHHLACLLRLIADEVRQGSPHGAMYACSMSLALAAYLFNAHGAGATPARRERGTLTAAQKARVLDFIRERLGSPIDLESLSAQVGVSRFHFLRLFKNTLGVTPHRFVMDQRLDAARDMLEQTESSLATIAAATGFSSQAHLCTAMRQRFGVTPGQWRSNWSLSATSSR